MLARLKGPEVLDDLSNDTIYILLEAVKKSKNLLYHLR